MAKKKDEKDVLVVRDEKTGEISVVAGLNADGSPKRIPAKAENAQSFLQFDRHGDVLDNFFKNFFRQCWKSHTNLTHPGKYFRPSKVKIMRPTSPK